MIDVSLRQHIRDGAAYANDARIASRRKLTPEMLETVQARLEAARNQITTALEEIERRQDVVLPRKPRRTSCRNCGELDIAAKHDDPHPVCPRCRREQLGQKVEIEKEG